jgi:hypothetical protein
LFDTICFYVVAAYTSTSVVPTIGPTNTADTLTIVGTNYANTGVIMVSFSGTAFTPTSVRSATYIDSTHLAVITPSVSAVGSGSLTVALDGQTYTGGSVTYSPYSTCYVAVFCGVCSCALFSLLVLFFVILFNVFRSIVQLLRLLPQSIRLLHRCKATRLLH